MSDATDGTGQSLQDASRGARLVFTDVRVRRTDGVEGADRVVMTFRGKGRPGWAAQYVDEPVADGSGERLRIDGTSFLDVYARGTTWPARGYYDGPERLTPRDGPTLADVGVVGTFEGDTQIVLGIDGEPVPFEVSTRRHPTRLVIDVGDTGAG